ncbi:glycosyltransferase family 2 protein [Croceicoccus sp. Ery15]|uniref:glycosyltransferase n=1 Tax=Croceicoccus sp. Ery15 TaxID=1703338 RepID=UPI001E35029B|nr:glycosyltransferase [Croceicoccus sp. Ery15]
MAPYSVIIPAHNEGSVIARLLDGLLGQFAPGDPNAPEVIVVCNGCSDDTATIARAREPLCRVIELDRGSKPLALNTGNAQASAFPRFFVDADVLVTHRDLLATAKALEEPEVLAAAPAIRFDLSGASSGVQAYYRVWQQQPYITDNLVGSGVFGLSREGVDRIGSFPDIIADDAYVRSRFASTERRSVARCDSMDISFTVFPPRDLRSLLHVAVRRRRGNEQLQRLYPTPDTKRSTTMRSLLASGQVSMGDIAIYLGIMVGSRILTRLKRIGGSEIGWQRDESSR